MVHVRREPCLPQELRILIFDTFHNILAAILWHFLLRSKDAKLLGNLLATLMYFKIVFKFFLVSFTIFLN